MKKFQKNPVVGMRVRYRFWPECKFHVGTVSKITVSNVFGISANVEIKRDGYRETAVLPAEKWFDLQLVQILDDVPDNEDPWAEDVRAGAIGGRGAFKVRGL